MDHLLVGQHGNGKTRYRLVLQFGAALHLHGTRQFPGVVELNMHMHTDHLVHVK
jgi:hypothetical protein